MNDQTAPTAAFTRESLDTGVQQALREVARRAASEAIEAVREIDVEATQTIMASNLKGLRDKSAESDRALKKAAIDEAKKHGRKLVYKVAGAVLAIVASMGTATWKFAGPEQATQRAEHAAERADEKGDELERRSQHIQALEAEIAQNEQEREVSRKVLVDGRLVSLEQDVGILKGKAAGQGTKMDALLDAQLGRVEAGKVKAEAAVAEAAANE